MEERYGIFTQRIARISRCIRRLMRRKWRASV